MTRSILLPDLDCWLPVVLPPIGRLPANRRSCECSTRTRAFAVSSSRPREPVPMPLFPGSATMRSTRPPASSRPSKNMPKMRTNRTPGAGKSNGKSRRHRGRHNDQHGPEPLRNENRSPSAAGRNRGLGIGSAPRGACRSQVRRRRCPAFPLRRGRLERPRSPYCASLLSACESAGTEPALGTADYATDACILQAAGIPTLVFGPGDIAQAHSADESIDVEEILQARRILETLLF